MTETQTLTLEDVPKTDRLKAGFFRLEWEGWGPEFVLSISGDQSWGSDAVLEVGTSEKEKGGDSSQTMLWKSSSAFQPPTLTSTSCNTCNSKYLKSGTAFGHVVSFAINTLVSDEKSRTNHINTRCVWTQAIQIAYFIQYFHKRAPIQQERKSAESWVENYYILTTTLFLTY